MVVFFNIAMLNPFCHIMKSNKICKWRSFECDIGKYTLDYTALGENKPLNIQFCAKALTVDGEALKGNEKELKNTEKALKGNEEAY